MASEVAAAEIKVWVVAAVEEVPAKRKLKLKTKSFLLFFGSHKIRRDYDIS